MEYKIDTLNYLKISPDFSYAASDNQNNNNFLNTITSTDTVTHTTRTDIINGSQANNSHSASPSGGINVLYNHKFHKKNRNFSLNTGFSFNRNENELNSDYKTFNNAAVDSILLQQITSTTAAQRSYANFSYTEPLGKTTYLEAQYNFNYNNNESERLNYRIDTATSQANYMDSLSSTYNFQFVTHRVGLNFRGITTKYNYTLGLAVQPSTLSGEFRGNRLTTHTLNWIPTARFVYNFERSRSFSMNYNGTNNQPSFVQLQPQPDLSNPQNIVYGNPNLKPEFTNNLSFNYNQFDMQSGNSLFANVSFSQTSDRIVSNTKTTTLRDSSGAAKGRLRETRYLNTDGAYAANANYTFSKPFSKRKYTVSLNGNVSYSNNLSFIEDQRNVSQNWVIMQGAKLRVDLDSIMDTELTTNYTINSTNFSAPGFISSDAQTWVIGLDGRSYFFKRWTLGYSFSQTINQGFSRTVKANPTILTSYIECQFLKKNIASLRLQAFDILD
ncbi:MAG: hypothetical protein EOP51_29340, partial [Sphingobacteriales bacterium]